MTLLSALKEHIHNCITSRHPPQQMKVQQSSLIVIQRKPELQSASGCNSEQKTRVKSKE